MVNSHMDAREWSVAGRDRERGKDMVHEGSHWQLGSFAALSPSGGVRWAGARVGRRRPFVRLVALPQYVLDGAGFRSRFTTTGASSA